MVEGVVCCPALIGGGLHFGGSDCLSPNDQGVGFWLSTSVHGVKMAKLIIRYVRPPDFIRRKLEGELYELSYMDFIWTV